MASWDVVATVRASEAQCRRFVGHYLTLGASQVTLFHDDPDMAVVVDRPGASMIVCDGGWWKKWRPPELEERQVQNATFAMRSSKADWILHCDIDEYCHARRPISDVLADLPDDSGSLMIRPVEAVYASEPQGEDLHLTPYFKVTAAPDGEIIKFKNAARRAFGDISGAAKNGFWGHLHGKSFIRIAAGVGRMPIHGKKGVINGYQMKHFTPDIVLRHFDTQTFDLWKEKHLRRISGDVIVAKAGKFRAAQQELIKKALADGGDEGLRKLYLRMSVLPPDRMAGAIAEGYVAVIQPEPHLAVS